MTCSLSFWLQMSEPITHIDTDNCMTIHHKGTSYFVHSFKRMIIYHSLWLLLIYSDTRVCVCHSGCSWVNQLHTWTHIITPISFPPPLNSHLIPPVPLLTFMYVIMVVIYIFILYSYTSSLTYSFFIHAIYYHWCTCTGAMAPPGLSILNQLNHTLYVSNNHNEW